MADSRGGEDSEKEGAESKATQKQTQKKIITHTNESKPKPSIPLDGFGSLIPTSLTTPQNSANSSDSNGNWAVNTFADFMSNIGSIGADSINEDQDKDALSETDNSRLEAAIKNADDTLSEIQEKLRKIEEERRQNGGYQYNLDEDMPPLNPLSDIEQEETGSIDVYSPGSESVKTEELFSSFVDESRLGENEAFLTDNSGYQDSYGSDESFIVHNASNALGLPTGSMQNSIFNNPSVNGDFLTTSAILSPASLNNSTGEGRFLPPNSDINLSINVILGQEGYNSAENSLVNSHESPYVNWPSPQIQTMEEGESGTNSIDDISFGMKKPTRSSKKVSEKPLNSGQSRKPQKVGFWQKIAETAAETKQAISDFAAIISSTFDEDDFMGNGAFRF